MLCCDWTVLAQSIRIERTFATSGKETSAVFQELARHL